MKQHLPKLAWLSYLAAIVAISLLNLYYSGSIKTEKVPMQWGVNGQPNWFAPKTIGLWMIVVILAVTAPGVFLSIKQNAASAGPWYWIGMILTFSFIAAVYAWHISAVMAWADTQS
ncbi:DUF1648 domain-containing protein [Methylorubrum thiocyanatum]|uniref:DUF1648 domain-containing protein n=1 Tax=Methylorubrum thiocyanatum TaxID=47958 RepID=UPI003F7E61E9